MTITSTPSEITYAGDGVSTVFTIPFVFDTSADLKVVETVAGLPTVVTTGFSIAGGAGLTGTLTRSVALPIGTNILILDNPALTQPVDYVNNDAFPATTHEGALDRLTRITKRLNERVDRSLRVADGDLIDGDNNLLPIASVRAGKFSAYDAQGRPAVASGTGNDSALRTDLAVTTIGLDGARLLGYRRTEAQSIASTVSAILRRTAWVEDFGAVGDGATDDTAAFNAAYSALGPGGGATLELDAKTYKVSSLLFDGALNLRIRGKSGGNVGNTSVGSFANATVIRCTAAAGNAVAFTGSGYTAKALVLEDLMIHSASTGYTLSFSNCSDIHLVRAKIINDANAGSGVNYSRCYYVNHWAGTMVLKGLNQRTAGSKGVNIDMVGAASFLGGEYLFDKGSSLQTFQTGLSVGDANPSAANETYATIGYHGELIANENGASLQHGVKGANFDNAYIESNTNIGLWITLEATAVSLKGAYFNNPTAGVADVLCGLNGAVNAQYKKFYNVAIESCVFASVNIAGILVKSVASSSLVRVKNNNFTLGTAGALGVSCDTATACDIDDDNTFTGFAAGNDVNGSFLSTGTFTAAITGLTTSPAGTAYYKRRGQQVTMFVPGLSGTSNNVATTVTGLPSHLIPTRTQGAFGIAATDNGAVVNGYAQVNSSGVINLYPSGAFGNWTNVNGKGFSSFNTTYLQS